jgi:hypothetical protein
VAHAKKKKGIYVSHQRVYFMVFMGAHYGFVNFVLVSVQTNYVVCSLGADL